MIKRGGRKNIICQKISETLCQKCICDCIIVPYINVCNPNHPWRIWSKLVLLCFTCSLCIKVFFSKNPRCQKGYYLSQWWGLCFEKINFIKKIASYLKILKIIWATNFFLASHVCPLDAHRYFIICNVWVLVFEIMAIKNIPFSYHWQ